MSNKTEFPSTFFVDVHVPTSPHPMREQVHFSPGEGLYFNRAFARQYWYLDGVSGVYVDRRSHRLLSFYDSVGLLCGRSIAIA